MSDVRDATGKDGLGRVTGIRRENLRGELYFQSLVEQAHALGLLGDDDVWRLQYECLTLLAYKTERYNGGRSSSIKVEKAQSLMASNLFTIGVYLKTFDNPDDVAAALQTETIPALYEKGRHCIDRLLTAARITHTKLKSQLIDCRNVFYHSTLTDAVEGFFKLYDPDYAAQEIHITADYPLCCPVPKLAGIEFIKAYLERAYCENLFCTYFDTNAIHHLLCGYAENYQELPVNIYEIVLTTALACQMAGTAIHALRLTEREKTRLQPVLAQEAETGELLPHLQKAAGKLQHMLGFEQTLMPYIESSLPHISENIRLAARNNLWEQVLPTPASPESRPIAVFSFGVRMNNRRYRHILDKIRLCPSAKDKLAVIREHIHTLADLEDILLDAQLQECDIQAVLSGLELTELAALCKKYGIQPDTDMPDLLQEREQVLAGCLRGYMAQLSPQKQAAVQKLRECLQVEESLSP